LAAADFKFRKWIVKPENFFKYAEQMFYIYHPNLAYIARDYGLEEIPCGI